MRTVISHIYISFALLCTPNLLVAAAEAPKEKSIDELIANPFELFFLDDDPAQTAGNKGALGNLPQELKYETMHWCHEFLHKIVELIVPRHVLPFSFDQYGSRSYDIFSPDDTKMLIVDRATSEVQVIDIATHEVVASFGGFGIITSYMFSSCGKRIMIAGANHINIWQINNEASEYEIWRQFGHESLLRSAHLSPDGNTLLVTTRDDVYHVWDVESQTLRYTIRQNPPIASPYLNAFNHDGVFIMATFDQEVRILSSTVKEPIFARHKPGDDLKWAELSRDGRLILLCWENLEHVEIWDWAHPNGGPMTIPTTMGNLITASFSADSHRIYLCKQDGSVEEWDIETQTQSRTFRGHDEQAVIAWEFDKEGCILIGSDDGTATIGDLVSGRLLSRLYVPNNDLEDVILSPDKRWIFITPEDAEGTGHLFHNPLLGIHDWVFASMSHDAAMLIMLLDAVKHPHCELEKLEDREEEAAWRYATHFNDLVCKLIVSRLGPEALQREHQAATLTEVKELRNHLWNIWLNQIPETIKHHLRCKYNLVPPTDTDESLWLRLVKWRRVYSPSENYQNA